MIISCVLPLLLAVAFGLVAPHLVRSARPGVAIWVLSVGGLTLTLCGVAALGVVVALGAGQLAPLAGLGDWSARSVARESPFQAWWVWLAVVLLGLALLRALAVSWTQGRRLRAAWAASRHAPPGLIVLADVDPFAYAVPGWPGRVVVSSGLLRDLGAPGRRAVLAHERAHLGGRHDLHQVAAVLAAALNPALVGVPAALHLACERSADETAAQAVGDRRAVARAIAVAVRPQVGPLSWAASGADVPVRVEALVSSRRESRLLSAGLLLCAVVAVVGSAASVAWLGHDLRSILVAARF